MPTSLLACTIAAAVVTCSATTSTDSTNVLPTYDKLQYIGFDLDYACGERSALRWEYTLGPNVHVAPRPKGFYFDPSYDRHCQKLSTKAYGSKSGYDRGHLVASEHMANSVEARHQAHYMTNITPQISSFNKGQWEKTEAIEACYRTLPGGIRTWGGVKYNESDNDIFVDGWGIQTPDYWWKVVVATDSGTDKVIAWWFPNRPNLGPLDKYLVTVHDIEAQVNDNIGSIPIPEALKSVVNPTSWTIPASCHHYTSDDDDDDVQGPVADL
ncbi:hypothetical protein H257_15037 [Aphanomyces astaci]|uniref:Endonuclease n=2 Tax=Aphanomyces astaci TaxID=112090 RepID=W4FQX4_APHAT|nr:hypothetical protein H257_15037 [Aphanomyces astaci]ETV69209.1 hypothetical protein H257_15037 [Aphanomyces astaci]|eukprot:XP_009841311.1 hypothetical protein H257_15037 [Aphanomyces astaci]